MRVARCVGRDTVRRASTTPRTTKPVGDISSVFPSLQEDYKPHDLPSRFKHLKSELFNRNPGKLIRSWGRLLSALEGEVEEIRQQGSNIIPSIQFSEVKAGTIPSSTISEIRRRGTVVIRGVISRSHALELKRRAQEYISTNQTKIKGFPAEKPAVYELYWAPSQVEARADSNTLQAQRFLQRLWYSSDPDTRIATTHPLTYADRFRIRNPGDAKFALGPHVDGGSLERWEDEEYSKVYSKILEGAWEQYDAFDAKHRVNAKMDLYNGAGACSMLRLFQGWMSMSDTGPGEGTLHVCPMIKASTAYTILRPFFNIDTSQPAMDSVFPGSKPGACQEYSEETHPHLELSTTMVPVPRVEPGDFVAWHCDSLHSVDREHRGKLDSSVLYIPATPLCKMNAEYLRKQREAAIAYSPPPDFPGAGGPGESGFNGAVDWLGIHKEGLQAMGMGSRPWESLAGMSKGEMEAVNWGNRICFP